jgi:hypothetical protein
MAYNRWTGQFTGQATSGTDSTIPSADVSASAATDINAQNYQQALNSISSSPAMQLPSSSSGLLGSMSPTTMVLVGVAAIGLIYFLTKK